MTIKCSALRTLNGQLRHQSNWGCNKHRLPLDRRTNNSLPPPLGKSYYAKGKLKKSTAGQQQQQKQGRTNEGFQQFDRWSSEEQRRGCNPTKIQCTQHTGHLNCLRLRVGNTPNHVTGCRTRDEREGEAGSSLKCERCNEQNAV